MQPGRRRGDCAGLRRIDSLVVVGVGGTDGAVNIMRQRQRAADLNDPVRNLSGGNQQKVILAKWLQRNCEVVIFDEPTRGIDVGAKYEIYTIINELASTGKGVIVISSEMPELLGICDRIYVMNEGRFVDEMPASEASQEKIMASIMRQYGAVQ